MRNASYFYLFFLILLMFVAACSKADSEGNQKKTEFEKMNLPLDQETTGVFAYSDEGELFSVHEDGKLMLYGFDGKLKASFDGFSEASDLCCIGNKLYGCVGVQNALVCLDLENGRVQTLIDETAPNTEVTNLVTAGGKIYAFSTDLTQFAFSVWELNPKKKTAEELPLSDVTAIYGASDGKLYYCAGGANQYSLYAYDADRKKGTLLYELDNVYKILSLTAFVYENDCFVFYSLRPEDSSLVVLSMEDGKTAKFGENLYIGRGKHLQCIAGNLVCYILSADYGLMNDFYFPEYLNEVDTEQPVITGETGAPSPPRSRCAHSRPWQAT